jgi:hypothetical protein
VISQDEMEQMQYILSEMVENLTRVRLTLFGVYGDTVLEGVPVFDGRLRIAKVEGVRIVDVGRVIKVELI